MYFMRVATILIGPLLIANPRHPAKKSLVSPLFLAKGSRICPSKVELLALISRVICLTQTLVAGSEFTQRTAAHIGTYPRRRRQWNRGNLDRDATWRWQTEFWFNDMPIVVFRGMGRYWIYELNSMCTAMDLATIKARPIRLSPAGSRVFEVKWTMNHQENNQLYTHLALYLVIHVVSWVSNLFVLAWVNKSRFGECGQSKRMKKSWHISKNGLIKQDTWTTCNTFVVRANNRMEHQKRWTAGEAPDTGGWSELYASHVHSSTSFPTHARWSVQQQHVRSLQTTSEIRNSVWQKRQRWEKRSSQQAAWQK